MKRFYWWFLIGALPIAVVVLFNYSVVFLAGETRSYAEVVASQQRDGTLLYGCIYNNDYVPYKTEVYRQRKPMVVAVGSSRTLLYRQDYFNAPFANCGLAIRDLPTGLRFFREVEENPTAKVVLLGLDQWWFNERLGASPELEYGSTGAELTYDKLFTPVAYWLDGKIDYLRVAENYLAPESVDGYVDIGLRAIEKGGGFRYDGSSLPDRADIVARPPLREFDTAGMKLIKSQPREYGYGKRLHRDTVDAFFAGVQRLRDRGVKVIVFLSPLAPHYYDYMQACGKYEYVSELIAYAHEKYGVYDYLNPARLGLGNKDFMDLIHMRPAGYARLLRDLVAREPELRKVVVMEAIESVIKAEPPR